MTNTLKLTKIKDTYYVSAKGSQTLIPVTYNEKKKTFIVEISMLEGINFHPEMGELVFPKNKRPYRDYTINIEGNTQIKPFKLNMDEFKDCEYETYESKDGFKFVILND